nr:hypothetical protein [Tanacetum cinerariifolium]
MTTSVGNNSQVPHAAAAVKGLKEVAVLMLLTMDLDIQWNLAHLGAYDMLQKLKAIFSKQAEQEILQTNYNMHGMGKTVDELHAMLKLHEDTLPKKDATPALHAIRAGRVQKTKKNKPHKAAKGGHGKGKSKMGYALNNVPFAPKPKTLPPPKKDNHAKTPFATNVVKLGTREGTGLRGSKKLKPGALSLYMGDGHRAAVEAIGTYHLELPSGVVIVLNNFHYAPSITRGVISVSRLFDGGFINRYDKNNVILVSKNNLVYFMAVPRDGIFEIDMSCFNTNDSSMYAISNKRSKINLDSSLLWHCRLRDISKKCIEKLQHDGLLNSIDIESLGKCVSCMSGKMERKPYSHQVERAKDLLRLIHTDVFQKEVENQLGKNIKSLRSDRGGKYMSQKFLDHLKEHGIIAHRTTPYTSQHNVVLERRNQTLLDMVRSMMSQTTLPKSFWDYALETVARILNMDPTKKGCEELVKYDTLTKPDKLDPRSFRCIVIGYPKETMGYSFYNPSENNVFVAQNAEYFENDLIELKASGSDDQEINEPQSVINPIRKSSRTRRASDRMCLYIDAEEHELGDLGDPANYKAALLDLESKKWLDAMNVEMQSMKDIDVWVLVELSPNARTVGSNWLFKKKTDRDGAISVFKARLVAKGFTQTYKVDYEETFSPVVDIRAIRILIAIAAYYDYEIWQMDVKTAFLNGHLSEEVYKEQHENLGDAAYILGIKNYRDRSKRLIGLCQSAYIEKILKRYYMKNSKRGTIPMQEKLKLSKSQGASTPAEKQHNMERELRVSCYTDAGYLTDADNRKSQTGYVFVLTRKAVWIHKFNFGLGIVPIIEEPISMYCDNIGAIAIAKDDGVTKGARHFYAKVPYLRETIKLGDVKIEKVDTYDNLADLFKKA